MGEVVTLRSHSLIQFVQVEVNVGEGGALNIHMYCGRRPGLMLSVLNTFDDLGIDIQQAVVSNFNGFVMDVYRAEVQFHSHYLFSVSPHVKKYG